MDGDASVLGVILGLMLLPMALLGLGVFIGLKLINRKPKK
jgi:hypothetical protein